MKFVKSVVSYFTLSNKKFLFEDAYSGNKVYSFKDCFGSIWLKDGRWSFFSIEMYEDDEMSMLKEAYDLCKNFVNISK